MASLNPRPPLSAEELSSLYPSSLQLHLVHVIFRHGISPPPVLIRDKIPADILGKTGERSPVKARFKNTGLTPCKDLTPQGSKLHLPPSTNTDTGK